ncbi:hypothetical protein [Kineosporia mesophila]|nr:hypothetical protein [Kineosporia mesophila]MCD5354635.1 hypothetical protein [Kineosporia mesophila]
MSTTEPRHLSDEPAEPRPPRAVAPTPKQVAHHLVLGLLLLLQLGQGHPTWASALFIAALLFVAYALSTDVRDYRATRKAG